MGRHSAPDDEDGDVLVEKRVEERVDDRPTPRGRHAQQEDDDAAPVVTAEPAAEAAGAGLAPGQVGKGDQPTAADLELLRTRPEVRNRVIAAVLAPLIVYTIVMVVIGSLGAYLLWVWLPLVTAGVLAGSILDAAHRKGRNPPAVRRPDSRDDEAGG